MMLDLPLASHARLRFAGVGPPMAVAGASVMGAHWWDSFFLNFGPFGIKSAALLKGLSC
jgi:hypothetical protein